MKVGIRKQMKNRVESPANKSGMWEKFVLRKSEFMRDVRQGDEISLGGAKLYLSVTWTSNKKPCKKAVIPPEEQRYQTKAELGLQIIKQLEGVIEYDWVGGDSVYRNSPELRKALRQLGKESVMDVGEELQVCVEKPHPYVPESGGRGRTRSRHIIEEKKIILIQI